MVIAMLKPYTFTFTTQSLISNSISNSHHILPSPSTLIPFAKTLLPRFVSQSHPHSSRSHQPIVCARNNKNKKKRGWSSNLKILQLASTIALNLKIFPEPFNSLITEIAQSDLNQVGLILNPGKKTKSRRKSMWLLFALICAVAGFLSWRISELGLFLRALFCVAGILLIRWLCCRKKVVKEWFFGFFFGIVLMNITSFRLGKEGMKFWVHRLRTCSSLAQFVIPNRNRNRNG